MFQDSAKDAVWVSKFILIIRRLSACVAIAARGDDIWLNNKLLEFNADESILGFQYKVTLKPEELLNDKILATEEISWEITVIERKSLIFVM